MMIEPTADVRVAATQIRQMHIALTEKGFSDDQAFELTLLVMESSLAKQGGNQ